jgi:hypothetical protein
MQIIDQVALESMTSNGLIVGSFYKSTIHRLGTEELAVIPKR